MASGANTGHVQSMNERIIDDEDDDHDDDYEKPPLAWCTINLFLTA